VANVTDKVYDRKENNSFVFEYTPHSPSENSITNFFIKEIAKYNLSAVSNTRFTFHYSIRKSIQLIAPNTFTVNTEIFGEKCTGDVYYKGFDISDILIPEKVDFQVIVVNNGNYVVSEDFMGLTLNDKNKCISTYTFESLKEDNDYSLILENVRFYSNSDDREKFNFRVNQIDNYYASIAAMDLAYKKLNKVIVEPNSLIESLIVIKETERLYYNVKNDEFIDILKTYDNDPAGYYEKLTGLEKLLIKYNSSFDILLNSYDYIELDDFLKTSASFYVKEVSRYLTISQEVSHSNSTYFYNLGKIDYNLAVLNSYFAGFKRILVKTKYNDELDHIMEAYKGEVFNAYLEMADKFINNEQFHLSKGVLANARSFFKTAYDHTAPLQLNIMVSKANYGIYDSYLQLIDRAIEIENYDLANNYIRKAQFFQGEHSSSIITDDHIYKISEKLASLYINKGNLLIEEGNYKNAIYCFSQAHTICHKISKYNYDYEIKHGLMFSRNRLYYELVEKAKNELEAANIAEARKCMDDANQLYYAHRSEIAMSPEAFAIFSNINFYAYHELIDEGKVLLQTGNYNFAYEKFLAAFELEDQSDFEWDDELPWLFSEASTLHLVEKCNIGEVKVRKNQLVEAREIYEECFAKQDEYGLIYQPELQESLTLLNNSIFNKHCEFAIQQFDEVIDTFNKSVDRGDFIAAIEILNNSDKIAYKNYYCEFDKELVVELRRMYSPAAEYQELAKVAQEALDASDHDKFIKVYQKMEELSTNYEVIRKHIEPLPLHYLFSVKKNLALLESSVDYYKNKEEFETALKLLYVLEENNYTEKETKILQQKLGNRVALAYKLNPGTTDLDETIEKYTEGNEYLKHFKKAYDKKR
jgi:hypothetical protein